MIGNLFDTSAANRHKEFRAQSKEAIVLAEIDECRRAVLERKRRTEAYHAPRNTQGEFRETLPGVVGTLASIMEAYDRDIADHQVRVASIACDLAGEMGWDEEHVQALRVASLLHDVGKMTVSREILNKPGRLDAEEVLSNEVTCRGWSRHIERHTVSLADYRGGFATPRAHGRLGLPERFERR